MKSIVGYIIRWGTHLRCGGKVCWDAHQLLHLLLKDTKVKNGVYKYKYLYKIQFNQANGKSLSS